MVTGTLKLRSLISWHAMYEIVVEGQEVYIYYYPDANTVLKIKLDTPSMAILKDKREQIISFLEQDVTLSGTIEERWEKQTVEKKENVEEWVKVL